MSDAGSDEDRLVLRPSLFPFRSRPSALSALGFLLLLVLLEVAVFLASPHVRPWQLLAAGGLLAVLYADMAFHETTLVALRRPGCIYRERRSLLTRRWSRKILHRFAEISAVEISSRVDLGAAEEAMQSTVYDVKLHKGERRELFWTTGDRKQAEDIARRLGDLGRIPVIDPETPHPAGL